MQADNEVNGQPCDNISEKNPYYNELTAMYWAWKNLRRLYPDVKYVGLFHYRRFLAFHERKFLAETIAKPESEILKYHINPSEIIGMVSSGIIPVVNKMVFPYSIMFQYAQCHFSDDYKVLREIIRSKFPDYYDAFIRVMEHSSKLFARNIFIMKYDDFVQYCEWLFAVLDAVDEKIPYVHYGSPHQRRVPAFMAERLFNVYAAQHKLKLKHFNLYFYEGEARHRNLLWRSIAVAYRAMSYIKQDLTFRLLNS